MLSGDNKTSDSIKGEKSWSGELIFEVMSYEYQIVRKYTTGNYEHNR
jgi:hypothetical protein